MLNLYSVSAILQFWTMKCLVPSQVRIIQKITPMHNNILSQFTACNFKSISKHKCGWLVPIVGRDLLWPCFFMCMLYFLILELPFPFLFLHSLPLFNNIYIQPPLLFCIYRNLNFPHLSCHQFCVSLWVLCMLTGCGVALWEEELQILICFTESPHYLQLTKLTSFMHINSVKSHEKFLNLVVIGYNLFLQSKYNLLSQANIIKKFWSQPLSKAGCNWLGLSFQPLLLYQNFIRAADIW